MIYFHKQNDHISNVKKNGIENSKKRFRKSMLLMSLFFTMVIALFISCGSGGDSDMTTEMGSDLLSGSFLDSAVEGLHYETATQSGTTDMDGMFTYLNGEVIRFLIGDVMLDHYLWGATKRISPEAPVPVVSVESETYRPGGAANVAYNLRILGSNVTIAGLITLPRSHSCSR